MTKRSRGAFLGVTLYLASGSTVAFPQSVVTTDLFTNRTVTNESTDRRHAELLLIENDEQERSATKKELLDAAVYLISGIDTDASGYTGDTYKSVGDLWVLGLHAGTVKNGVTTEYEVDNSCVVKKTVYSPREPSSRFTAVYNFKNTDGHWHWNRANSTFFGQGVWEVTATGKNAVCEIDDKGVETCSGGIVTYHQSVFERDRAVKALELIENKYCSHMSGKPF